MDICFEGVGQVAATFQVDDEKAAAIKPELTWTSTYPCGRTQR